MSRAANALRRRLDTSWWLLGRFLLVLGLVLGYSVYSDYQRTDRNARALLTLQANSVGSDVQRRLESINTVLLDMRATAPFWLAQNNGLALTTHHLKALGEAMEGVSTLTVFDAGGTIVASNRPEFVGRNFADRGYFQTAQREKNPDALYLSPPFKTELGVYTLLLVKSIAGPEGQFAGAVSAALEPEDFKALLNSVREAPDTAVGIMHGGGKAFLFSPLTVVLPGTDIAQAGTFFSRHQASGLMDSVMTGRSTALQSERLLAIHEVQPTALKMDFPLLISVGRDLSHVFAPWRNQTYLMAGIFSGLTLLSTLSLFFYRRRQLVFEQSKQSLRQAEARFSAFFESAMVGMATTSPEKGWLQVNPALCAILGYTREELVSKSWTEITHADDLTENVARFDRLLSGDSNDYSMEKRFIRPNGDIVHAFVAVRAVRGLDNQIEFFAAIVEDITERKKAEQQTRSALLLMQSFIDHLPGLAYIKDRDARILMANRTFQTLGFDPALLIGKTSQEALPGALSDKISRDDERVLLSGQTEVIPDEYGGRHYESRRFIIDDETGRRLLGGMTVDVTRRYRSIARSEALLAINEAGGTLPEKAFLDYGLALAERLTASSMAFLHFVNDDQESIELITWTANALKGCTALHDSHYPISQAGIWADCFHQRQAVVFNDYAAWHAKKGLPEGHAPLVRLISVPVMEEGSVRIMLGIGNKPSDYDDFDIETVQLIGNDLWRIVRRMRVEAMLQQRLGELGALNKKLAEAQGQLLQSEKLSAIGQLAAGVAHEINNPIGFVYSNLGTLADYVDDLLAIDRAYSDIEDQLKAVQPQAFERVQLLKDACDHPYVVSDLRQLLQESREGLDRVRTIVNDLKNFSRVGETGWMEVDLLQGLESTLNIVRNEIKYKADVVRELVALPPVRCIPSQINQVFMNLLVNAGQAIQTHGTITLRSGRDGDFVWIDVQDDGCGIAPESVARVFEPFFTSKPVGQGTGLGLSLAWGIVQQHHGTIELQSEPGKGTTFRVRLPIDGPPATTETQAKP